MRNANHTSILINIHMCLYIIILLYLKDIYEYVHTMCFISFIYVFTYM